VQNDWRKAKLTDAEKAMLEYAEKLTIAPSSMTEDDIEGLRAAGWSDRDILDIVHVCAYFNFRVRIVDGLGLRHTEERYEAARQNRLKAAQIAEEQGLELAGDIWGISQELAPTPQTGT
jgi:uncharacterized protein YciW